MLFGHRNFTVLLLRIKNANIFFLFKRTLRRFRKGMVSRFNKQCTRNGVSGQTICGIHAILNSKPSRLWVYRCEMCGQFECDIIYEKLVTYSKPLSQHDDRTNEAENSKH